MSSISYLFLHQEMDIAKRDELIKKMQQEGIKVPLQYSHGFEIDAKVEQASKIFKYGFFDLYTSKNIAEADMKKLAPEAQAIAKSWNITYTKDYRKIIEEEPEKEISLGSEDFALPGPFTNFDVYEVQKFLKKYAENHPAPNPKEAIFPELKNAQKIAFKDRTAVERQFKERFKDDRFAHELIQLYYVLEPVYFVLLNNWEVLSDVFEDLLNMMREEECWRLTGKQSVGVVLVDSSMVNGPKYSDQKRELLYRKILEGFTRLSRAHPGNNLSFCVDRQDIRLSIENKPNASGESDNYFIHPAIGDVRYEGNTYSPNRNGLLEYKEDLRSGFSAEHSTVFFMTPFGTSWHGYASIKEYTLISNHPHKGTSFGGWGVTQVDRITMHEICHHYGAADEYTPACSSCDTPSGCDSIPNGNCEACNSQKTRCMMGSGSRSLCGWSKAQLGWSDIFLEITTGNKAFAGTDNWVELDIGDRSFRLDQSNRNDFERHQKDAYAVWESGNMPLSDIKRILIRKGSDNINGGWFLKKVKVWHRGIVICDEYPYKWLQNNERTYTACILDNNYVNKLRVKVYTSDSDGAGTDDDVRISMGGKSWALDNPGNDFERDSYSTFHLDPGSNFLKSSIRDIQIRKETDGIGGAWKLKGIDIQINGEPFYRNTRIHQWLQGNNLTFITQV